MNIRLDIQLSNVNLLAETIPTKFKLKKNLKKMEECVFKVQLV